MGCVTANGVRQFFRREGDPARPALILAHPIGFDHGLWDAVMPRLTERYHVIRYDLRGHGASEVTLDPYSVSLLADDALALLSALSVDRFCFAGTSLGGLVGLRLAGVVPDRVERLVVANASARLPLSVEEWNRRIQLAAASGPEPFIAGLQERMFSARYRLLAKPGYHSLLQAFKEIDGRAYAAAMAALRDADLTEMILTIRTPTLVVAGSEDSAVPSTHSSQMAEALPHGRLITLAGGHLSAVESPEDFANAVSTFCETG